MLLEGTCLALWAFSVCPGTVLLRRRSVFTLLDLCTYRSLKRCYATGLSYAPLSIMSACFATVLVFDALIARCVLKKKLMYTDLFGIAVILLGIVLCAVYGQSEQIE